MAAAFCLGTNLARLELRVVPEELLDRCATIELAGEPQRVRSKLLDGIRHRPVRLR